jgi:hypothetical protein
LPHQTSQQMTDKFSESTKVLEMAAVQARAFNRQHAIPDTTARKPMPGYQARGFSEPKIQQPKDWKQAMERWLTLVSRVLIVLFFSIAVYFAIQHNYLFLSELATAAAIITLLTALQYCSKTATHFR